MRHRLFGVLIVIGLLAGIVFAFSSHIYGFLAVPSCQVEADIVVVEGWVPDYVVQAAADEFKKGGYREIVTSGLELEPSEKKGAVDSVATEAAVRLAQMGIAPSQILVCPTPSTNWNKTAKSARVVRETLESHGIHPKGINVVTIGVHSRRSWLAYQHAFDSKIPVGIFQIPETGLDPARWWASSLGIKRITRGYVAWIRERLFGASP
jgi:hypothetical protein